MCVDAIWGGFSAQRVEVREWPGVSLGVFPSFVWQFLSVTFDLDARQLPGSP